PCQCRARRFAASDHARGSPGLRNHPARHRGPLAAPLHASSQRSRGDRMGRRLFAHRTRERRRPRTMGGPRSVRWPRSQGAARSLGCDSSHRESLCQDKVWTGAAVGLDTARSRTTTSPREPIAFVKITRKHKLLATFVVGSLFGLMAYLSEVK